MDIYDKRCLIFGAGTFSHLISNLLIQAGKQVESFIVDDEFLNNSQADYPVFVVSDVTNHFDASDYEIIVGLGYTGINSVRRDRVALIKKLGFTVGGVISPHAIVLSENLSTENVLIFEHAVIQPYVTLGSNVIIRAGANIGHHSVVGNHSFIASGVVTGGNVSIGDQSFIGLGAVIRDNITIAERSFIGAGAVVVTDTEPDGVYVGNPAKRIAKTSMEVTSA